MKFFLSLLLTWLCVCSVKAQSQFKFKSDKDFRFYSDSLNRLAHITVPDFTTIDFQMRFFVMSYSGFTNQIYIVNHDKSNRWAAVKYNFCAADTLGYTNLTFAEITLTGNWSQTWKQLLDLNILSLPTEKAIEKKWKSSTGGLVAIADGVWYRIELLSKNNRRRYMYSNPEYMLEVMDLNNTELKDFTGIIHLLGKEFNFDKSGVLCYE